jgi:hypothetical protein
MKGPHLPGARFTPVILATQKTEIRRIMVQGQPRKIVFKTLSQKNCSQKKGWWRGYFLPVLFLTSSLKTLTLSKSVCL